MAPLGVAFFAPDGSIREWFSDRFAHFFHPPQLRGLGREIIVKRIPLTAESDLPFAVWLFGFGFAFAGTRHFVDRFFHAAFNLLCCNLSHLHPLRRSNQTRTATLSLRLSSSARERVEKLVDGERPTSIPAPCLDPPHASKTLQSGLTSSDRLQRLEWPSINSEVVGQFDSGRLFLF